jgi:hypothetical protein
LSPALIDIAFGCIAFISGLSIGVVGHALAKAFTRLSKRMTPSRDALVVSNFLGLAVCAAIPAVLSALHRSKETAWFILLGFTVGFVINTRRSRGGRYGQL